MSNVSIFEKKWLDLVFEGKNKKYGAYTLRLESSKTTLLAFVFGISFLFGGTLLLSSFSPKPVVITDEPFNGTVIHVDAYHQPTEKHELPSTKKPAIKTPEAAVIKPNAPLVVAPTIQAQPEIPTNTEQPRTTVTTNTQGSGDPGPSTVTNGGSDFIGKAPSNNKPVNSKELDRQPMFPNGLKGFYEYVGNNFERQEIEEGETVRVLVSFVIEKNGSMTDIEVIQKTTPAVDNEAVRVLKSLKTKWTPGYKDGAPVRTQYTLPITVRAE
jgi:protein TonB